MSRTSDTHARIRGIRRRAQSTMKGRTGKVIVRRQMGTTGRRQGRHAQNAIQAHQVARITDITCSLTWHIGRDAHVV